MCQILIYMSRSCTVHQGLLSGKWHWTQFICSSSKTDHGYFSKLKNMPEAFIDLLLRALKMLPSGFSSWWKEKTTYPFFWTSPKHCEVCCSTNSWSKWLRYIWFWIQFSDNSIRNQWGTTSIWGPSENWGPSPSSHCWSNWKSSVCQIHSE